MRRSRLLALFAALALIFAACGDDDDASDDVVDTPTSEETTTTEADDDETTTTTEDEDDDDEEATGGTGGITGVGECGFLAEFATAFEEFDANQMFGEGEGNFGDVIAGMATGLDNAAKAAPSDIKDEFQLMADGFSHAADQLAGVSFDISDPSSMDPEVMQAFEEASAVFEDPQFMAASDRIADWMEDACPDFAPEGGLGIGG